MKSILRKFFLKGLKYIEEGKKVIGHITDDLEHSSDDADEEHKPL